MFKFSKLKHILKKITLIDKCLIIFMAILILQSIYSLFNNNIASKNNDTIDIVIRTTSAAIFGYFLSANFIKKSLNKPKKIDSTQLKQENIKDINEIEQTYVDINKNIDNNTKNTEQETSNEQIIIATIIGITCLCVLIVIRNFIEVDISNSATISQMRDFVSGCVGFLLGCPTCSTTKS